MPSAAQTPAVARNALVVLAVIAAGCAAYWLSGILTPFALAVFLAIMIDGFARVLEHRLPGVSRRAALPLALLLSVLLFGGATFVVVSRAPSFFGELIDFSPKLMEVIGRVAGLIGVRVPHTVQELVRQLDPAQYLGEVARALQSFASTAAFVLVYLGFILASRRGFERKIVGLFPGRAERQDATATFLRIRDAVEQYLWVQTVTGLMVAGLSWVAMAAVGLHNSVFWAFLIFLAVYIPVIGGTFAGVAPPLFALMEFDSYWPAVILLVALQAIGIVIGNVVYPRMQGRSLNIDPIVVLLALAFWGALWGIAGMFLSTPLTVMAMVILAQFKGARWIAVLLSADGEPEQLRNRTPGRSPDEGPHRVDEEAADASARRPERA
ncbi:AI-2E family transporter [Phenylobacterium soli]|uniref:AI-2E family transporter n=1 Tax=Phenylobacterium soli TaxID=2170551 RepID=A0A328AG34_9CAUL|nr:AI-2E family transporter [Phenylobacterium soli]RAK53561.1 AI-2E family transporter [Phenylobacterium soli]